MVGNGHQNIRRVEDEAIAKADRNAKRTYRSSYDTPKRDKRNDSTADIWRYRLVNGKWQLQTVMTQSESEGV